MSTQKFTIFESDGFARYMVVKTGGEAVAVIKLAESYDFEAFRVLPFEQTAWEEISEAQFGTYETFGIPVAEYIGKVNKIISKPNGEPLYKFSEGIFKTAEAEVPDNIKNALTFDD
jgi:hypothetical protein